MWTPIVSPHRVGRAVQFPVAGARVRLEGEGPPVEGVLVSCNGMRHPARPQFVSVEFTVRPAVGPDVTRSYSFDPDSLAGVSVWSDEGCN